MFSVSSRSPSFVASYVVKYGEGTLNLLQASGVMDQRAEENEEAVLEEDVVSKEQSQITRETDAESTAAETLQSISAEAPVVLSPEAPLYSSIESARDPGDTTEDEQQLTADHPKDVSVHQHYPQDESTASATAQDSEGRTAEVPAEELYSTVQPALGVREPTAELSYSDITALLTTSESDAHPAEASSSSSRSEEDWPGEHRSAGADGSLAGPTAPPSGALPQPAHEEAGQNGRMVDLQKADISQQRSMPQPPSSPQPEPHSSAIQGSRPDQGTREADETIPEEDISLLDNEPGDLDQLAGMAPTDQMKDRAHLTPQSASVRGTVRAADAAEQALRQPAEQQQGVAPEIREFLASQGLQHILEGQQMDMPELQAEDVADQLSPCEHGSQTDANLLEVSCPFHPLPWMLLTFAVFFLRLPNQGSKPL